MNDPRRNTSYWNSCSHLDGPCFLCLCVHKKEARFKVGVSNAPLRRFAQLPEAYDVDLARSMPFRFASRSRAVEVEKSLHRILRPFQAQAGHYGDGYSEWFELPAIAQAIAVLEQMPELNPVVFPKMVPAAPGEEGARHRLAALNVIKVTQVARLWWVAAAVLPIESQISGARRTLVLHDIGRRLEPGSELRVALQDVEGTYGLLDDVRRRAPACMVRLIASVGEGDLHLHLQPAPVLARLPGGARLNEVLVDGLEGLRARTRAVSHGIVEPLQPNDERREAILANLRFLASSSAAGQKG